MSSLTATFSDGHTACFKYNYIVADGITNPNIAPGHPDVNWDCDGLIIP